MQGSVRVSHFRRIEAQARFGRKATAQRFQQTCGCSQIERGR